VITFEQYGFEDSGRVAHEGWKEIDDHDPRQFHFNFQKAINFFYEQNKN
jgi:hypothetical protein